ncbi:hypothetical protein [Hyphobacterium marinum]|uniref:Uncharacterized protein n=1 Tax=Hyphobacterium marinum TaxID=3116574 RepID=A0ABU7LZX8_9PROT|nr:hypothetical protein [Hyphobacterium sp. Y6023]MEE2567119.1 hypothetical protein [Hyphobacterium sp. Y6023]
MDSEQFESEWQKLKRERRDLAIEFSDAHRIAALGRAESARREVGRYRVAGAAGAIALLASQIPNAEGAFILLTIPIFFFSWSLYCSIISLNKSVSEQIDFPSKWTNWSMKVIHVIGMQRFEDGIPDLPEEPKYEVRPSDNWAARAHGALIGGGIGAAFYLIERAGAFSRLEQFIDHFTS